MAESSTSPIDQDISYKPRSLNKNMLELFLKSSSPELKRLENLPLEDLRQLHNPGTRVVHRQVRLEAPYGQFTTSFQRISLNAMSGLTNSLTMMAPPKRASGSSGVSATNSSPIRSITDSLIHRCLREPCPMKGSHLYPQNQGLRPHTRRLDRGFEALD